LDRDYPSSLGDILARATSPRLNLVVGLLCFAWGVPAHAQYDGTRHGGWFIADFGYGSAHLSCDTCRRSPHLDGLDVLLGVGGMPWPRLRLGAVLEVWEHPVGDGETLKAITTATATLYYYPRISGLFLEGGMGLSDYRVVKGLHEGFLFENADATPVRGTGWGLTVGLGYDFRIGQEYSIGPRLAYAQGAVATLHSPVNKPVASGWTQSVLSAGITFGIHAPDNRWITRRY